MGFSNLWAKRLFTTNENKLFGVLDTIGIVYMRLAVFISLIMFIIMIILFVVAKSNKEPFTTTVERTKRRIRRRKRRS